MWFETDFYKYTVGIILVLLIILLVYYTAPFFAPILWFVAAILLPVLFSTLLYYILRPVFRYLENWIPRPYAILLIYAFLILGVIVAALYLIPSIVDAVNRMAPEKIESLKGGVASIMGMLKNHPYIPNQSLIEDLLITYTPKINAIIYSMSLNLISTSANIAIALLLTPFVLFYFLKDDTLLTPSILRYIPNQFQDEVQNILHDIDSTLSEFIQAQLMIATIIGSCILIGYLIIGLPNALALALFAMIFYVIPFLGTFIAVIPALIVASTIGFSIMLKVVVVVTIAHLIEANLVTPRLMSQRLNIHPLTIIFLLLAAGTLYGLIGLLLVTPTYAILKVIVWNLYKISRLRYVTAKIAREEKENETKDNLPA